MPTFLTQDHLDLEVELAASSTAGTTGSARVLVVVPGAPGGEVRYVATVVDGLLVAQELVETGASPDVDVTVTTKYRDAKAALAGEVDPNAAFMSGRTKVAGATGPLLAYLAATSGDGYRPVREQLAAATTFDD